MKFVSISSDNGIDHTDQDDAEDKKVLTMIIQKKKRKKEGKKNARTRACFFHQIPEFKFVRSIGTACTSWLHIFSVKRNFAQFLCTFHKLISPRKHSRTFVANQEMSQITRFYKTLGLQNYDGGNFAINFTSACVVGKNIPHPVHFPTSAHCTLHSAYSPSSAHFTVHTLLQMQYSTLSCTVHTAHCTVHTPLQVHTAHL